MKIKDSILKFLLVIVFIGLTACGGGGGGTSVNQSSVTAESNTNTNTSTGVFGDSLISVDVSVKTLSNKYSYTASKAYPADQIVYAIGNYPIGSQYFYHNEPLAWAIGDFYNNKKITLYTAKIRYTTNESFEKTILNQNNFAEHSLWELESGKPPKQIWKMQSKCLHPRKAVISDFNQDGLIDLFVACHGYDAAPFPGEKNEILINNGNGFNLKQIGDIGFYHGASAVDINGDGYPDVAVVDNTASNIQFNKKPYVYFLINDKNGGFIEDYQRINDPIIKKLFNGYFSLELMDVDADGNADLVIGSFDGSINNTNPIPTKILYGQNGFFGARSQTITPVDSAGSVLDFILKDDYLYVARTDNSYNRNIIQKFNIKTNQSSIVFDKINTVPNSQPSWVGWWIPTANGLRPWNKNILNDIAPY